MIRTTMAAHDEAVACPHCNERHYVEDYSVRVLNEQCYFKCPGDGKEFEIIVREKIPDGLMPAEVEDPASMDPGMDSPGTMGGEPFTPEAEAEAEEIPELEELPDEEPFTDEPADEGEDEESEEEKEAEEEEDEDEKKESYVDTLTSLVESGLPAGQALDLFEMCGPTHMGVSGGVRPGAMHRGGYECPMCGESMNTPGEMVQHMEASHGAGYGQRAGDSLVHGQVRVVGPEGI